MAEYGGRPIVRLNCAVGLDGLLAGAGGRRITYSGREDWQRVHRMRADADAILVGVETILADDPSLRVKPEYAQGPDPIRVVLDRSGRTPPDARVRTGPGTCWILDSPTIEQALAELVERGVTSVLVEGGAQILAAFLAADAWDEWTVYVAPMIVGEDGPRLPPVDEALLRGATTEPLGAGVLWRFSRA